MPEPLVYTVEEAAAALRIGRTAAYEAARRGQIPVVRIGRSLRVPRHQLDALLGLKDSDAPVRSRGDVKLGEGTADASGF
jgi:excisionase family DNA binding protein